MTDMPTHRAEWESAVYESPRMALVNGVHCLTRRDDVITAASQPDIVIRPPLAGFGEIGLPMVPLSCPAQEHSEYRRALRPLFTKDAVVDLLPELREQATALIGGIAAEGRCDAVTEVAAPFSAGALLAFLGFPIANRDGLIQLRASCRKNDLTSIRDLLSYVITQMMAQATDEEPPRRGRKFLSDLLARQLTYQEVAGFYTLMVVAGLDNPTAAIGFALWELARNPRLRDLLRRDTEQMLPFIDEILRVDPPVLSVPRVTTKPVSFNGTELPTGSRLSLVLGAVNMQGGSEIWVEDGRVRRQPSFSFGVGPRHCLGIHLARLELQVILTEWLRKIPNFAPAPGFEGAFAENANRLTALPLCWEPK